MCNEKETPDNDDELQGLRDAAAAAQDESARARQELQDKLTAAQDDRMRALAEAQNVKRNAAQDVDNAKKYGALKMVADVLEVMDNFDRAVQGVPPSLRDNPEAKALVQGVEMIQGMLKNAFARHGVHEIEAKGQKFDPNMHQAVMQVPATDDVPAGHVGNVMQRGYTLNGRLVRPAVVTVAQ